MKRIFFVILILSIFAGCVDRQKNLDNNISSSNNIVIQTALKYIGKPYKYGATGPNSFDCSGFVYAVYKEIGKNIPRTSIAQSQIAGKKLNRNGLKAGDLVFFDTSLRGHVNHSGIYLGNQKFIHASSGKAHSVTISSLNGWYKDKFRWGKRVK
jgi:cell wall-associated NlpC family hydrolase